MYEPINVCIYEYIDVQLPTCSFQKENIFNPKAAKSSLICLKVAFGWLKPCSNDSFQSIDMIVRQSFTVGAWKRCPVTLGH